MGKITFDTDACKGCGLCVAACPHKLIQLSAHINEKGYNAAYCTDEDKCVACGMCYQMCPDCVIRVERRAAK
jgi:2-oxoglutarate ferredoxin oxidoreductase subunit delta